jgi:hypothetical protein
MVCLRFYVFRKGRSLLVERAYLVFRVHALFIRIFAFLICIHSEHGTASSMES